MGCKYFNNAASIETFRRFNRNIMGCKYLNVYKECLESGDLIGT